MRRHYGQMCFRLETLVDYGSKVKLVIGMNSPFQNCLWCRSNGVCAGQVLPGSLTFLCNHVN